MPLPDRKLRVLFFGTGNACRSQMAEGFARAMRGDLIEAFSAGLVAHGKNPIAVRVMAEAGCSISGQESKTLDELDGITFDYVVTVCSHADENCPAFPDGTKVVHAAFDNAPRLAMSVPTDQDAVCVFRRVRDDIRAFIEQLPDILVKA